MPADEPAFAEQRVGIVGLGLMGASLALALRGRCAALVGHDRDAAVNEHALAACVVDAVVDDLAGFDGAVDVLVLAVPVDQIVALLRELPEVIAGELLVLDLGSTKRAILAAMDALPPRLRAVGGHPMCGKTVGGLRAAEAGLFRTAPFALVRSAGTDAAAWATANQLVDAIGAFPVAVSAEDHDRFVAQVSHAPYLLAAATALSVSDAAAALAGPGLRDVTRLARTPQAMIAPVLAANRDAIAAQLDMVIDQLGDLRDALTAQDDSRLLGQLQAAAHAAHRWSATMLE